MDLAPFALAASLAAAPPGEPRFPYEIAVDAESTALADVLPYLATLGDFAVVVEADPEATFSVRFADLPFPVALDRILKTRGLSFDCDRGVAWVSPAERVLRRQKEGFDPPAAGTAPSLVTVLLPTGNAPVGQLAHMLEGLLTPAARITPKEGYLRIVDAADPVAFRRALEAARSLDRPFGTPGGPADAADNPEEYLRLARELARTLGVGDAALLVRSFDAARFAQRVAGAGVPAPDVAPGGGADAGPGVVEALAGAGIDGCRLVRVRAVNGEARALLRMTDARGLAYRDLVLERRPEGRVRVVDVWDSRLGMLRSEFVRRTRVAVLPEPGGGKRLRARVLDMRRLLADGRFEEADRAWRALPGALQRDRTLLIERLEIASHLGVRESADAAFDFQKKDATDPALYVPLVDAYLARKDFAAALHQVDLLDLLVGGDGHLNLTRARIALAAGWLDRTRELARAALDAGAPPSRVHRILVETALRQRDWPEVVRLLEEEAKHPALGTSDTAAEAFREFRGTEEYRTWAAR